MQRVPVSKLVRGPAASPERILFYSLWFKGHNNPIVAELLLRMARLDACLLPLPGPRLARGVALRAYQRTRRLHEPAVLRRAGERYRWLFTGDPEQAALFPGGVAVLLDDPYWTPRELGLLNRPNVKAIFVTRERAGQRLVELGVETPTFVIPQGVSLRSIDHAKRDELIREKRARGAFVAGYHASFILTKDDRGGDSPPYNVDHLLEQWDAVHERAPRAELWLLGGASDRVRARCAGRSDIVVLGRKPRSEYLAYVAAFDVGLYARAKDTGVQSAKVIDYLGAGVPVVGYDYDVVRDDIGPTGAGVLVDTPAELVAALVALAGDAARRDELAAAAARAGAGHDWDILAERYAAVLDERLPTTP